MGEGFLVPFCFELVGTDYTVNSFVFNKNKVVCEDHFHPNCIAVDKQAELLGYVSKRRNLKSGAVPTIFSYKTFSVINMNGEEVATERQSSLKRSQQKDHSEVCIYPFTFT